MKATFLSLFIITTYVAGSTARESAWNGHTPAGSEQPAPFTPYYVPLGSKSYSSSNPLIKYSGKWVESYGQGHVDNHWRWTSHTNASASFTFVGTGIEWFGRKSQTHGAAHIYIDGQWIATVDNFNEVLLKQQRLASVSNLQSKKHTFKIVNTGLGRLDHHSAVMDVEAFIVTREPHGNVDPRFKLAGLNIRESAESEENRWTLEQKGETGVNAMQLTIISSTHALIVDKVEHNPLTIDGHPAWAALYNLQTHQVQPLAVQSNSFCAGGTFLRNGTLINVGGNPVVEGYTNSADFGDLDGLQAIRVFELCTTSDVSRCQLTENHSRLRLASPRWYNTVLRISDGSAMIIGGSKKGGWINNATVNNPTLEYFPPKSIHGSLGLPIMLPFLVETLNSNLFPIAFALSDGTIFIAANNDATIYNWQTNQERRLPSLPNGVRVTYPMTGTGLLLPLSPDNDYASEILICGGSTIDDKIPGYQITSQDPATNQCSRMLLTDDGISAGWQIEHMPQARHMPDAVLLPTGAIIIVNGAGTGISGYSNVLEQVGQSNADNPVLQPVLYDPKGASGQRFSSVGLPTSQIPRMYHSVATLTPSGKIMIAGSNPNLDRSNIQYGTEYRTEWLSPPYMSMSRPAWLPEHLSTISYGEEVKATFKMSGETGRQIRVALMDFGYVTHAVHANSRLVYLKISSTSNSQISFLGPPNGNVYPPGPGWLFLIVDDIPSEAIPVMVGDGLSPPVDEEALQKYVARWIVEHQPHSFPSSLLAKSSNN